MKLLLLLIRNEGRILERAQLLDQVWENQEVSDRSVDLQVCRLRKQLKGWDRKVSAVYGKGYILEPT